MWRVKAQANESICVASNTDKEVSQVMSFERVDKGKTSARKRVTFATNLVADVFG